MPQVRRSAPLLAGVAVAALGAWALLEPQPVTTPDRPPPLEPRPNIVLVILDTLRADVLGCYGHSEATSPELDRLAKRGVRFAQTIAQSSWTRPSIGSLLTSHYPRTLGIQQERSHALSPAFVTLPEVLQEHGYVTLGVTANPNINSTFNFDQGMDAYIDSGVRFPWMKAGAKPTDAEYGQASLMTSREVFDLGLELLGKHQSPGTPFYLQLNVMDMHEDADPRMVRAEHKIFGEHRHGTYLAALHQLSQEVSRFVAAVEALPHADNTLFVITSDHGEGLDSHPHVAAARHHGSHVYESQVLVPLILYHSQGRLPQRVVEQPIRLLDLMPTLLDLASIPGPETMRGSSLVRALSDQTPAHLPSEFVVETQFRKAHALGVYSGDWLYVEHRKPWRGTNPRELQPRYKLQDGSNTNQLSTQKQVADTLRQKLLSWERDNPPESPTLVGHQVSSHELQQLRALGYID